VIVVPAHGGKPQNLSAGGPNAAFPSFSRDGRWIYFCSVHDNEPRVWKMPVSGGAAVKVTNNDGTVAVESSDGRYLYYVSAVERPGAVWRVPIGGEAAVRLFDGVVLGSFDVTDKGIYFIDRLSGEFGGFFNDRPGGETRLQYFDFLSERITTVARNLGWIGFGLSASRDGRTVFYSRIDSAVEELMVVDDFR
jgi:hypothetical protein